MNIEAFLIYIMKHNATIIEVLVGLILLTILFLAIRSFVVAKDEPAGISSTSMSDLEESLKKILEKANQVPMVASAASGADGAGASVETGPLLAEINKLKGELESKQKKIEELASAPAASGEAAPAGSGISAEEKAKMQTQIQELQAKLSEYEIISEDIADLSFYKEQNARLQKELADAKGGVVSSTPAAAPVSAEPTAPAPAAPAAPASPVDESLAALTASLAAPVAAPSPEEAPPAAPPVAEPVTTQSSAPTEKTEEAAPVENVVDQDLMAEFEAAVEKQQKGSELGDLNMDKMMAEAASIKTDGPEVKAEDVLNQSLDENKLLAEANAMKSESEEDKKLMGQFENFVKKGES